MDELTTPLIVFGLTFVVFVLALPVLAGLDGACGGSCDASGEPGCDLCPKRHTDESTHGGAR
jgi:hypothetical protein